MEKTSNVNAASGSLDRLVSRQITCGPKYDTRFPFPISYYKWTCPACGDVNEDPAHIHETMCHNGHEVELAVATDFVYEQMVATLLPTNIGLQRPRE